MKRVLLWLLVLVLTAPLAMGTDINVSIYNYSSSRVVMNLNYQWYCILEPQEYRGLSIPWDVYQYLDFYRYPDGNSNATFHVMVGLGRFHPTEAIYVSDNDLP